MEESLSMAWSLSLGITTTLSFSGVIEVASLASELGQGHQGSLRGQSE